MPLTPCCQCGMNYMKSIETTGANLCNCCVVKEERRNPKRGNEMDTIDILIKCPKEIQKAIEEECIRDGFDFFKYFINLHNNRALLKNVCVAQPPPSFSTLPKSFPNQEEAAIIQVA